MGQTWKRALLLTIVLLGGAAAAMAWSGHATTPPPASPAVPAVADDFDPPEPPDPPDPPEPPEDSDDTEVFVVSSGMTWLGVRIDDLSEEKASDLKLKETYGAVVTQVEESSPAMRAGLKENDVVVSYQGQRVESAASLRRFVRETPDGRTVSIGIVRDGSPRTLSATIEAHRHRHSSYGPLGRLPSLDFKEFKFPGWSWSSGGPRLGISVNEMNGQLAEYFGVKEGEGVLVMEVFEGTPAEKAGLKAGDVILRVGGDRIDDAGDIHDAIRDKAGKDVDVNVIRNRKEMTLKATLDAESEGSHSALPRGLREQIRQQVRSAHAEARRAREEAMTEQREAQREYNRALREAGRSRRDAPPQRLRVRARSSDLIEI